MDAISASLWEVQSYRLCLTKQSLEYVTEIMVKVSPSTSVRILTRGNVQGHIPCLFGENYKTLVRTFLLPGRRRKQSSVFQT